MVLSAGCASKLLGGGRGGEGILLKKDSCLGCVPGHADSGLVSENLHVRRALWVALLHSQDLPCSHTQRLTVPQAHQALSPLAQAVAPGFCLPGRRLPAPTLLANSYLFFRTQFTAPQHRPLPAPPLHLALPCAVTRVTVNHSCVCVWVCVCVSPTV